jgi:hypothetical protein
VNESLEHEEKATFFPCCSRSPLGLKGLEQEESPMYEGLESCCPRALGLEGLEQDESLIYEGLEQTSTCLK